MTKPAAWELALAGEWVHFKDVPVVGDFNWHDWHDELHAYALNRDMHDALVAVQAGWGDRAVLPFILQAYTVDEDEGTYEVPRILIDACQPDPARDRRIKQYLEECAEAWRDYEWEEDSYSGYWQAMQQDDYDHYQNGGDREWDPVRENAMHDIDGYIDGDWTDVWGDDHKESA